MRNASGKLVHWRLQISQFEFDTMHLIFIGLRAAEVLASHKT